MQTAKTLIRLGGAQVDLSLRWAYTHFVGFSCRGSILARNICLFIKWTIQPKYILFKAIIIKLVIMLNYAVEFMRGALTVLGFFVHVLSLICQ